MRPSIYFQFDGFESETYRIIRGEPDILEEKLRALDRLAEIGLNVTLVPAIERGVNEHEIGKIIEFAIKHPAVRGINFQPAFHAGRHTAHDPMQRMTIPDILRLIEAQTAGKFVVSDFVPVPCCFPTCNSVTYAFIDGDKVTPLPRIVNVDDYLDYITNRVMPDFSIGDQGARWKDCGRRRRWPARRNRPSSSRFSCQACGLPESLDGRRHRAEHVHDHAAGFHGSVDLQPEEPDEVLQGVSAARRQADSVLRLQHGRLSRAGARAAGSGGAGAASVRAGKAGRTSRGRSRSTFRSRSERMIRVDGADPVSEERQAMLRAAL